MDSRSRTVASSSSRSSVVGQPHPVLSEEPVQHHRQPAHRDAGRTSTPPLTTPRSSEPLRQPYRLPGIQSDTGPGSRRPARGAGRGDPSADTIAALRSLWATQAEQWLAAGGRWDSGLVVVTAAGAGPPSRRLVAKDSAELCRGGGRADDPAALGAAQYRQHSARMQNVPPAAVARLLGHTVRTHLQTYVRSTVDSANRAAVRLRGYAWRRRHRAEEVIIKTKIS